MLRAKTPIRLLPEPAPMIRVFLIVLAAGLVAALVAVLYLGAFPPKPVEHHVERTMPNDQFKPQ